MIEKIKALAQEYLEDIITIRRHLHQHPEMSFKEFETSKYVQSKLSDMGIPYKSGFVETGIVAHIYGKNPESNTIALRADLDALPILEENTVPYVSQNRGVMHACGHDVHTANVLGAARILNALKNEFEGTVKLIFQPGEELLPGGASLMIKEGALKSPDATSIIGQHVYPSLEVGKVGFRSGMYMASTDEIYLTVKGKGGHAALPHLNIDPVLISSHIIVGLQQIVSRFSKPDVPVVLSFGKVSADGATNIIPHEVHIEGTFRTMNESMRFDLHERIKSIATGIAESMGGSCVCEIRNGYPFLVNNPELTSNAIEAAKDYLGEQNVVSLDLRMTAEDFAYYSQQIPGCFYRLGIDGGNSDYTGLHTSTFNVDESCMLTGMGLMSYLAINALKVSK